MEETVPTLYKTRERPKQIVQSNTFADPPAVGLKGEMNTLKTASCSFGREINRISESLEGLLVNDPYEHAVEVCRYRWRNGSHRAANYTRGKEYPK